LAFRRNRATDEAKKELKNIFDGDIPFDTPKPVRLLDRILSISTDKDSIIIDFFSGSSTTANAIIRKNLEDMGQRKFIMIQLPELCKSAVYKNICEIGKERIRRAGKKTQEQFNTPHAETQSEDRASDNFFPSFASSVPLRDENSNKSLDIGFKVFRLAPSNFKKWQNYTGTDIKVTEDLFSQYENPILDNWKEEDLLTEIMLAEGFPLDSMATIVKDFKKNKVTQISSDFCEHSLFICLDNTIYAETIKALTLSEHDIFICLDNAVTDQDKVRLDDKGLIKTI